ncbi:helix-turn-helix domain-containing protein [Streptomyces sp. NPDC102406]|uniref:helix-turn-helix domain-containing protein n=1 Tax=Streptomyces sp. NPDC102406 TaxID=3366171 RepID=UPI00380DD15E
MAHVPIARHLLRARDLADARYADADMAAAAGLSPAHISRCFKAAFGESPDQYPLARGLERAAALLRVTDWTVAAIGVAVGARSIGSFTTSFRRMYRMTPQAYLAAPPLPHGMCASRAVWRWPTAGRGTARFEKTPDRSLHGVGCTPSTQEPAMTTIKIAHAQFWVHDQDAALHFYTKKLAWEVRADVTTPEWNYRWLCVAPPGGEGPALVLMPVPGQPMLDEASSAQLSDLGAKGAGGTLFLETDDCEAAYDELSARGVEFTDPPTPQPYGIDTSFRDPSGNNIGLTQVLQFDPERH